MATTKSSASKRTRHATSQPKSAPKRTRKRRRPRPPVKAELPEPIASFEF